MFFKLYKGTKLHMASHSLSFPLVFEEMEFEEVEICKVIEILKRVEILKIISYKNTVFSKLSDAPRKRYNNSDENSDFVKTYS